MKSILVATILAIATCLGARAEATPPVVELGELTEYWLPAQTVIKPETGPPADEGVQSDSALVEILIDNAGRVSRAQVVEYAPEGSNPEWARQVASQMRFQPAPGNSGRAPVITRIPVAATDLDALRIDGSSDDAMLASIRAISASLPDQQKVLLRAALLQLSLDGIGSLEEMQERFPDMNPKVEFLRERLDGMTVSEILAEAAAASGEEGAPRLILQGIEPR